MIVTMFELNDDINTGEEEERRSCGTCKKIA
jgi:hypothetical protein